jgi:hypothetical protein
VVLVKGCAVGGDQNGVAELLGFHEDHAATGNSGWGSLGKILDLEHHSHSGLQLDNLTGVKAELLVIVKHSVHVLNPNSIDGAVEHEPLTIGGLRFSAVTNRDSQDTILPLTGVRVKSTVELGLLDRLGVNEEGLHVDEFGIVSDSGHGVLEHLDDARFTREGTTDDHETVTDADGFVQLNALLEELSLGL